MNSARPTGRVFLVHGGRLRNPAGHEAVTHRHLAQRLADLLGYSFAGEHQESTDGDSPVYFVPDDTLPGPAARRLGITGEQDLFGGVVPYPFIATKVITHPLVGQGAAAPDGWSHDLPEALADVVLGGFSAFSVADTRRAGERLLAGGSIRLKAAAGIGGKGQWVVGSRDELDAVLTTLDAVELGELGIAIEQNLQDPTTYSVGQTRVGDMRIAYHGTQRLTTGRDGRPVYGGSDLVIVRGDMQDLLQVPALPAEVRLAIEQARRYDAAVRHAFPGFFASRCNYDVVCGRAGSGAKRSGVLEQSWRIGGASAAELAGMEAFAADARLQTIDASTHEVHALAPVPAHARIHYRGEDPAVGKLTKYSVTGPHRGH